MVTNVFALLLQELGKATKFSKFSLADLHPDANNSCLISFLTGVNIQIELDKTEQFLIIGCPLGTIRPGKYRENLFCEALRANGMKHPRYGNFAYSEATEHLLLFDMLPLYDLTGEKTSEYLEPFLEKAEKWRTAISTEELPVTSQTQSGGGLFGLLKK